MVKYSLTIRAACSSRKTHAASRIVQTVQFVRMTIIGITNEVF